MFKSADSISVLLIEDDPDHASLVRRCLRNHDHRVSFDVTHRDSLAEATDALTAGRFDVVVTDLSLPDSKSETTLRSVASVSPNLPIVVLTSLNDPEFGASLIRDGAQDFLVKSDLSGPLITRSILYAIERKRQERQQRDRAEELAAMVAERTSELELLLAVAEVVRTASSTREAWQQVLACVCTRTIFDTGQVAILPDESAQLEVELPAIPTPAMQHDWSETRSQVLLTRSSYLVPGRAAIPVLVRNRVHAILELESESDGSHLQPVLEQVCGHLGTFIEKIQLESSIEETSYFEQRALRGELHDGLGHELIGLTYLANSHAMRLAESESEFAATADSIHRGLRVAVGMLRRTVQGMASVDLEPESLPSLVRSLLQRVSERFEIVTRLESDMQHWGVTPFAAGQVYRIVQEAVTNCCKHSNGKHVVVDFEASQSGFVVTIADDGKGIRQPAGGVGIGMETMHHRARILGGYLSVGRAEEGGTAVRLEVPNA